MKEFEAFHIILPTTTQNIPSKDLAQKYYPTAEIRRDMSSNQAFLDNRQSEEDTWLDT